MPRRGILVAVVLVSISCIAPQTDTPAEDTSTEESVEATSDPAGRTPSGTSAQGSPGSGEPVAPGRYSDIPAETGEYLPMPLPADLPDDAAQAPGQGEEPVSRDLETSSEADDKEEKDSDEPPKSDRQR